MAEQPEDQDVELTQAEISEAVRGTEQELLESAFKDDPDEQPPDQTEAPEDEPEQEADKPDAVEEPEQPRDQQGRFVARDRQQEQPEQPAADPQRAEEPGDPVPRWRTREIAEERRQAVAERDALRAELARIQAWQAQQQQTQQPQQQIDPLLDPQGWQRQIEASFADKLYRTQLDFDLRVAHMQHGKTFEAAYEALLAEGQRGNGELVRQLTVNPSGAGERMVAWFNTREASREMKGKDIKAYKEQLRQEFLKDPEFVKAAIEAGRSLASGHAPGRPNNITQLPPSLSRVPGSSPRAGDPDDGDNSDDAVFAYAMR